MVIKMKLFCFESTRVKQYLNLEKIQAIKLHPENDNFTLKVYSDSEVITYTLTYEEYIKFVTDLEKIDGLKGSKSS
ncbi:MAG: hypothetical protein PWP73_821 [Methanococcus sp.]|jgi:hypothetical protein|nr:hypothetical protein [Methanococcus sp.]